MGANLDYFPEMKCFFLQKRYFCPTVFNRLYRRKGNVTV